VRELLLDLDLGSTHRRRAGIEGALRRAIRDGRLVAGSRLPSTRTLAAELGVARSTVVLAYEQLSAEGYLDSRRGSGTVVAAIAPGASPPDTPPAPPTGPALDLVPGEPDRSLFPRDRWLAAVRRALEGADDAMLAYGDRRGVPALRRELAAYLGRTRAVVAHPDQIAVLGGMTASFAFLAAALRRAGVARLAVEDPYLPPLRRVFSDAGLTLLPVPVDDDGVSVTSLRATGAGAVVVTPAHQYPLGPTMSAARRADLVQWAVDTGGWIVEDDYDGEFRYDRRPIGALQGLAPERVVYAGTASKTLAAGLRLAWLVVPPALADHLDLAIGRRGGVSGVEQAALACFLDAGDYDRQVRRARGVYRHRRDRIVESLTREAPHLELSGVTAGLHLTARVRSRSGPSEAAMVERARARGVAILGLSGHYLGPTSCDGLVVGYSRMPEHRFAAALERLIELVGPH